MVLPYDDARPCRAARGTAHPAHGGDPRFAGRPCAGRAARA